MSAIERVQYLESLPKEESHPIAALAASLSGSPSGTPQYEADALVYGLESERVRLGARRFLVAVYQQDFDYDGLTDYVYLLESFDAQPDAEAYAESLKRSLLQKQLGRTEPSRGRWALESEGEMWALPNPPASTILRAVFDSRHKLRAGPYDTLYTCIRVIGPFVGPIVDLPLFDFINTRHELWSYFVDVGRAKAGRGAHPAPL